MPLTEIPKFQPRPWVFNQIACQFPEYKVDPALRQGENQRAAEDHALRISDWFAERVRHNLRGGAVTFEVYPPFIPKGRHDSLLQLTTDMFNAYEVLFEESAEHTVRSCLRRLAARDLKPEVLVLPLEWPRLLRPAYAAQMDKTAFLGITTLGTAGVHGVHGAFAPEHFGQYEPLRFEPEVWAWYEEGPSTIRARFEAKHDAQQDR